MRLALCQLDAADARGGDEGIRRVETHLEAAAKAGAHLAHLPELTLPGYGAGAEALRVQARLTPGVLAHLGQVVDRLGVSLALGMPHLEGDALTNVAAVLRPGEAPIVYTKRFLFGDYERDAFSRGSSPSPIFEIGGLRAGILVCYDVEFPENVRQLAQAGADLVIVPTALPAIAGSPFIARNLIPTRAFENSVFVSYADWCGADPAFKYQGLSVVAAPDGSLLAQAKPDSGATMLLAEIDLKAFDTVRNNNSYLSEIHTRPASWDKTPAAL